MRRIFVLLLVALCLEALEWRGQKVVYDFSAEPIDVVIPCCRKDIETLDLSIDGILKNGKNIRRVIVVSSERLTDKAEWFDEAKYPFSKESMAREIFRGDEGAARDYLASPRNRLGWLYQQLLKLYATFTIPEISSNVLVVDADVIFLNEAEFMSGEGAPYFAVGREKTDVYFAHASRLLPGLGRVYPQYSGIAHHMLLQRPILEDLFSLIERHHGIDAWKAFCRSIDSNEVFGSPFSEYEIYFNFTMLRTNQAVIRPLKRTDVFNLKQMEFLRRSGYVYIACHEWWRTENNEPLW